MRFILLCLCVALAGCVQEPISSAHITRAIELCAPFGDWDTISPRTVTLADANNGYAAFDLTCRNGTELHYYGKL